MLVTASSIHILKIFIADAEMVLYTVTLYQGFWNTSVHVPVTVALCSDISFLCTMDLKLVLCNKGMRMKVLSLSRPEIDSIITA